MARRRMDGSARSQQRTAAQIRAERAEKKKKIKEAKMNLLGANTSIRDAVTDINTMIAAGSSKARIKAAQTRLEPLRTRAKGFADELKRLRNA